jgi:indolepyruvate ferredoxin oxidoreductase beta subunit
LGLSNRGKILRKKKIDAALIRIEISTVGYYANGDEFFYDAYKSNLKPTISVDKNIIYYSLEGQFQLEILALSPPQVDSLHLVVKQSSPYADRYLARLSKIREVEAKFGNGTAQLLNETARYTALWMTYEDTIRVADLKTRRSRFQRVSTEAKIGAEQIMEVREYLHPMSEEIADTLPTPIGKWILRTKPVVKTIEKISENGIILNTASISGYCLLYFVARLKPIRPRSLRFNLEQERIETWLAKIAEVAPINYELACEIAECANVIKGYGETHRNGWRNFTSIMVEVDKVSNNSDAASRIKELRLAALADEDGTKLRNSLNA